MSVPRIDNMVRGCAYELSFPDGDVEHVLFSGITGDGEDREAWFVSLNWQGNPHKWAAYRDRGRWVYGSSAERIRVSGMACAA